MISLKVEDFFFQNDRNSIERFGLSACSIRRPEKVDDVAQSELEKFTGFRSSEIAGSPTICNRKFEAASAGANHPHHMQQ